MNVKKKARRVMSGLLTAVTVLSTVLSPAVAYASDDAGSVKKIPYYEEIKDQLDEDEVVTAKDYEIKVGDNFDVRKKILTVHWKELSLDYLPKKTLSLRQLVKS